MNLYFKLLYVIWMAVNLFSCSGSKEREKRLPVSVKTVCAAYSEEVTVQEFPFISKPYRSSELSFRVGGPVKVMDIHPGERFGRGDLIAAIDPRDYHVKADRARALYEQLKTEYARIENLYKLDNIPASVYEKAKADYQAASASYTSAKNDLDDTRMVAPFDGYIQDVLFEQYQDIRASQPVCSFIDVDRIKIEIFVPQQVAMTVKKGEKINVRFDAMPDKRFVAEVEQISKGAAKNNLSFLVTAILPNGDESLFAGMPGKAVIDGDTGSRGVLAINQSAVRCNPTKGTYVWTVRDGSARYTPVTTGRIVKNSMIEVVDGLAYGDSIISTGIELISDGTGIKVVNR